jgi:peptidoglycan/xylan/chitin deacetylase (PgdA/CDA1 family)
MTQLESALLSIIGKYPAYMRPPYFSCGSTCLSTMDNLGYHVINTNLDTQDWQYDDPTLIQNSKDIFASAINAADPSSMSFIPLTHDVHQNTVTTLVQYMIDTLKARGFRTTTVGWCLDDNSANWYRTTQ